MQPPTQFPTVWLRSYSDMGLPAFWHLHSPDPNDMGIPFSYYLREVRVKTTGDEYIIRILGMGMPKTRECPYHCDTGNWTVWGDEFWSRFLCNFFTANKIKVNVSITAPWCNWTKLRFSPQQTLKWPTDCCKERWIRSSPHQIMSLPRSPIATNQLATNGEIVKWLVENMPQTSIWQLPK